MSLLMQMNGGPDPRVTAFQVLGERSSGTNFVIRLLRRNLDIPHSDALGWKHGFPHMVAIPPGLLVIALFRHPLDWVRSMYAKPWHTTPQMQQLEFSAFIRAPWETVVDRVGYFGLPKDTSVIGQPLQLDRDPLTGSCFANMLQLRTAKAKALLGLSERTERSVLAAFESVLEDPEAFVSSLADRYDIPMAGEYVPIGKRLGQQFKPLQDNRPKMPDQIAAEDLDFIVGELDPNLEARLGYRI